MYALDTAFLNIFNSVKCMKLYSGITLRRGE